MISEDIHVLHRQQYSRIPTTRSYHCSCCFKTFEHHETIRSVEGKAAGLVAGLMAGAVSKNVLVGLGVAIVGALVGHWIDEEISPSCPLCGELLKLLVASALQ
jgi:hypothetical protein